MRHPFDNFEQPRIPKRFFAWGIVAAVLNFAFWGGLLILAAYLVKWVMA